MEFVFITDTHFKTNSNVRTGQLIDDQCAKLQWVVDYCNAHDAILLHSGDWFDSPSQPDLVKFRVWGILSQLKSECYTICGNHDMAYRNRSYMERTSYNLMVHMLPNVHDLDTGDVDLGDVILTSKLPLYSRGKKQICLFHGFLNIEDGENTVHSDELVSTSDPVYALLGHDHVEYSPLQVANVTVFRPGSFTRMSRQAECSRVPKMLHISTNGGFSYKTIDIPARDYDEVFQPKPGLPSASELRDTYDSLLTQLNNLSNTQLSFEDALQQVATPAVCEYIAQQLLAYQSEISSKTKNL